MPTISKNILNRFFSDCEITDVNNYGNGHINNTYLVTTDVGKYILQQVNSKVFNIKNLVQNYDYLIETTSNQGLSGKLFPESIADKSGLFHFIDSDGTAWRLNTFIENSSSHAISPGTMITKNAGRAMGKFQLFLTTLNVHKFKDTIPDFHNPLRRLNEFESLLNKADIFTKETAVNEIMFAQKNKSIALKMSDLLKSNVLPDRITHNDTKLENILFDNSNNYCYVIDLDTVMKGSILFDFGDMVRSITSLAKEDETDLQKVSFSLEHFEALCKGYLHELKVILTPVEKQNILLGTLSIIYEQSLRFLTDHLSGNIYYKVDYPTHNLIRCRTQFKLLEEIINNQEKADEIIQKYTY